MYTTGFISQDSYILREKEGLPSQKVSNLCDGNKDCTKKNLYPSFVPEMSYGLPETTVCQCLDFLS